MSLRQVWAAARRSYARSANKARIREKPKAPILIPTQYQKDLCESIAEILSFYTGISIVASGMGNPHSRSMPPLLALSCLRRL